MYYAGSTVFHVGGGTLNKTSAKKTYLNFRNNLITVYKNSASEGLLLKIFTRLVLDGIAAFKFLLDGQPKDFIAVARAHSYFYKTFQKQYIKRKAVLHSLQDRDQEFIFPKSIVLSYYLKGISKFSGLGWGTKK